MTIWNKDPKDFDYSPLEGIKIGDVEVKAILEKLQQEKAKLVAGLKDIYETAYWSGGHEDVMQSNLDEIANSVKQLLKEVGDV